MKLSLTGMTRPVWRFTCVAAFAAMMLPATSAVAAECNQRGTLANIYCDENGDLVADTPKDPKKLLNPDTLVFAYTPVEDPAIYADIWKPFIEHLKKVTGKDVRFFAVQSNAAEIEEIGRAHV